MKNIVILILAAISISMLSGDNGILNQASNARNKTIHANVFEQLQLEELSYLTGKTTSRETSTLIGYLQAKSIIGNEVGEDTGKYQINVTALLGSKQSLGNGDATSELKDVYMLEKQSVSSGSIINTKVASTTTTQVVYKVIYYGSNTTDELTLGNLSDSITTNNPTGGTSEDTETLKEYFIGKYYDSVWIYPITLDNSKEALWLGTNGVTWNDYILYNGKIYEIAYDMEGDWDITNVFVSSVDVNPSELGMHNGTLTTVVGTFTSRDYCVSDDGNGNTLYGVYRSDIGYDCFYNDSGVLVLVGGRGRLSPRRRSFYLKSNIQ